MSPVHVPAPAQGNSAPPLAGAVAGRRGADVVGPGSNSLTADPSGAVTGGDMAVAVSWLLGPPRETSPPFFLKRAFRAGLGVCVGVRVGTTLAETTTVATGVKRARTVAAGRAR